MTRYLLDTNFLLRYFLKDNLKQLVLIRKYLQQAKQNRINLIIIPQIMIEMEYVLRKVYKLPKEKILKIFKCLLTTPDLIIYERHVIQQAIYLYEQKNIDLMDIYLFYYARTENAKVFTFDKDFDKMATNF